MKHLLRNTCLAIGVLFVSKSAARGQGAQANADRLYDGKRLDEAKAALIGPAASGDAWSNYWLGRIAIDEKRLDDAETFLKRAISIRDTVSEFHFRLGEVYGIRAQNASFVSLPSLMHQSKGEWERAAALSSSNTAARDRLIDILIRAPRILGGSHDEARLRAEEIRKVNPFLGGMKAAAIAENEHDVSTMEREYRALVVSHPDSLQPLIGLGEVYIQQSRWTDALSLYDTTLRRQARNPIALYGIGRVAAMTGQRMTEGEANLHIYLTMPVSPGSPTYGGAHFRIGQIEQRLGNVASARHEYETAIILEPRLEDAKRALSNLP